VFSACTRLLPEIARSEPETPTLADVAKSIPDDGKLNTPLVKAAMAALARGDYVAASRGFSKSLRYEPQNAALNVLNGLAYHLRGVRGDTGQYDYAEVGYRLALNFDPNMYPAAILMGHLRMAQGRHEEAADEYAYALQFEQRDSSLWLALANASYHAGDLPVAAAAVDAASRLGRRDAQTARAELFVKAAAGLFDDASAALTRYRELAGPRAGDGEYLAKRIEDWRAAHAGKIQLAQLVPGLGQGSTVEGLPRPDAVKMPDGAPAAPGAPAAGPPRMCMIDVVIIRTEEIYTTNKGVNLLAGLRMQFTGSQGTSNNKTRVLTHNVSSLNATPGTTPDTSTRATTSTIIGTLASAFTIPLVTYDLNIFNDEDEVIDVIARPTLVGIDGKASDFFSGSTLHVNVSGGVGTAGSIQQIPVGVRLGIIPKFIDADSMELSVTVNRAFIEAPSAGASFQEFLQTNKTEMITNVVMKFDETLILSGLSEKETGRAKNGVPFLKNLPVVQYLFSNEQSLDFTKSVLILLTPRRPRNTHEANAALEAEPTPATRRNIRDLRHLTEFRPPPNVDAIIRHMHNRPLFMQFRTGDVRAEKWDEPNSLATTILRILRFLYY